MRKLSFQSPRVTDDGETLGGVAPAILARSGSASGPGPRRSQGRGVGHLPPARDHHLHSAEEEPDLADHPDARHARRGVDQHADAAAHASPDVGAARHPPLREPLDQPVEEAELAAGAPVREGVERRRHRAQPAGVGGDLAVVGVLAGLLAGQAAAGPLEGVLRVGHHARPQPRDAVFAVPELRREASEPRHPLAGARAPPEVGRDRPDAQPCEEEVVAQGPEIVDAGVVHRPGVELPSPRVEAARHSLGEVRGRGQQPGREGGVAGQRGAPVGEVGQGLRVEPGDIANGSRRDSVHQRPVVPVQLLERPRCVGKVLGLELR
mmetsp:Transcript_81272/g.252233  ORF Transcript_81272/g.252233 Transcript_81272/m.252233 type:complete len:322 (+) Transcript_81272:413-1378(+)